MNDVCETLGAFDEGIHAGTLGTAATFSFYYSHHITTIEGGGIATNSNSLADDLRSIRSHGWARDRTDSNKWELGSLPSDAKFKFVSTGFNIRPLEIQATIGISQMEDIEFFLSIRRRNAKYFYESVKGSHHLTLIGNEVFSSPEIENSHSWMMFPIVLNSDAPKLRNEVVAKLNKEGIETRPMLSGNFLEQHASKKIFTNLATDLKFSSADFLSANGFLIGNSHNRTLEELNYLSKLLLDIASGNQ